MSEQDNIEKESGFDNVDRDSSDSNDDTSRTLFDDISKDYSQDVPLLKASYSDTSSQFMPSLEIAELEKDPSNITPESKDQQNCESKTPGAAVEKQVLPAEGPVPKQDTPALSIIEFADKAQLLFPKLNTDGDDVLSYKELSTALQNNQFKGQDAQVVAALFQTQDKLKVLSDDQTFGESGVTVSDLNKFKTVAFVHYDVAISESVKQFLQDKSKTSQVDTDSTKDFLSKSEIEKALQMPGWNQEDRLTLSHMLNNYDKIQAASDDEWSTDNDGITAKDGDQYRQDVAQANDNVVGWVAGTLNRTARSQQADSSYELFGAGGGISADAIRQGLIGDCYFESALAAVAASNPDSIRNMIHDNQNGTYTVTFPGDTSHPVTVSAPTEAEAGIYNGVGKDGSWALVMEKAYGKYRQDGYWLGTDAPPAAGGDGGGYTESTTKLLTGASTDTDLMNFTSQATTVDKLTRAFAEGRAVTAAITPSLLSGSDTSVDGFQKKHAYSITGFTPDGMGGGTVTVRNPWGGKSGTTSGEISMSIEDFTKNFSRLVYEQPKS